MPLRTPVTRLGPVALFLAVPVACSSPSGGSTDAAAAGSGAIVSANAGASAGSIAGTGGALVPSGGGAGLTGAESGGAPGVTTATGQGTSGVSASAGGPGGIPPVGGAGTGATTSNGGTVAGGATATGNAGTSSAGAAGGENGGGNGGATIGEAGAAPIGDFPAAYDEENTGADCPVATTFPSFEELPEIAEFPDPFLMENGDRITSRAEWRCRRAEISAQIQQWELGTKPPPSAGEVTATYSGNTLTVNVQVGGESITLSTTINLPNGGSAPYPALIQMAGSGVPANIFTSRGVATMSFSDGQLAGQFPTRGQGPFWDLFPDDTAGAYAGWAWGVSRIIDGLELTADQSQIDTKHLAVSGCSYAGKMALWAGAFDERIALTIPEESGGGGEASWRFMAGQPETEHLEAAQGTGWYSERLEDFGNPEAPKLPFDQHSLVAMVAPRAILAIQNTGIARLGSQAGGASMKAAAKVYEALGVSERIGFSQAVASGHCAFPSSQTAAVEAFVDRFLLGDESVDVAAATEDSYDTDLSEWVTWDTPALE